MRRGVVTAVVACVLAAGAADAAAPADTRNPSWLQRRLETGLAQATGGTVRIGRMDVDWTKLSATVGDVAISIPAPGAPPLTATIGEGRIKLAWSGLPGIGGGQVHITEVIARGATFSLSREWIDAFTPKSKGGGPVAVQIDRVVIENAAAEYLDGGEHVRVRTTAMDFRGAWSTSRQLLVGEVRADATVEAPIFNRAWPATVRGGLRLGAGRLEIFGATAKGPGASAELAGNVTWDVGASFTAQGSLDADLATLAPFLVGQTGISGRASGPVQIVYTGGVPIRVVMQAATTGFRIGPITTETARADLTIRPGHLEVDVIDARAYRGAFNGTVGLTFGNPLELRTDLSGRGADLARLISLAGKDLPISSAADVTFKVVGDPGKLATWSGGGTFTASPVSAGASGRIPAGGRGRLTFASGQIRVIADSLEAAEASLRFAFDAELAGARSHRLSLDGTTRDARKTQVATMAILDAFGVERNRFVVEPLTGAGGLHAALVTSGKSTTFDLGLDLASGSYAGEPFDRATLDLGIGNNAVTIRRVDLTGSGQSLAGSVRIDTRTHALDEIDLVARNLGIAKLLTSVGVTAAVDGRVELDLRGYREDGVFAALGHLQAANVIVGHEIIDTVEGPVRIEGDRLVLVPLVAKSDGLDARLSVIYDLANGEATVNVEDATIDVGCNRTLADAGLAAMGTIRTEGLLTITRDGPSGLLSVDADELLLDTGRGGLREILLGDLAGSATIAPRGVELAVASLPDRAWTFEAFLGFDPKLPLSAVLYFEDLLVGAGGTLGESVDVRLKGQVQAEGDLTEPRAMEINGGFDEVAVRLGPRVVKSVAAFPLRLDNGRFALGPAQFAGESSDLEMGASGSIEAGDIAGYLKGKLDLAIVSSLWSELRGAGPLTIDATLAGTLERPDYGGRITVRDGRLRLIGYPQSLESIDAEAVLAGQTLTLTSFHAVQGGGEIAATGRVEFTGVVPTSLTAEFTGANVSAKYPEGFKGTYQGTIGIEGTRKRATISGRIEVVRGLYSKDFDVGLFGGSHREFDAAAESPFPRNIFLDVDIVAPGNVWLRNDVASVEAEGQIHLGGELARPEVTGHFNLLPGGTVTYRDVEYRIDYGTLDQTDPKRINPYLEFRGHTKVAEYDIALRIEGTLDKFEYELTSTPPLDSQDIISLLVTGKTLDTLSGSATAAAVPTDMAAYYFAGLLNTTFGKQIQTSLGIDTLAITPQLLKGESDPTARVTVGKQVSDTVKIAFSQDIGTAQKQTYSVSWDATRRIRFVAEDDTEEGLGGELQYARQFGGTPMASTKIEGAGVVASVQVVTDDGTPRPDLVKKTKLVVGKPFDRGRMLQGGDRIRSALLKQGFIQATVRAEATLDPDKTDAYQIVYRVTVGPKIVVEVVMSDGGGKRSAKKSLKAFWRETPYTPDFWDEATRAMLDDLQERGYYAADVTWHATDGPSGRTVRVLVDRGKAVRLRAVRFTGGTSIPRERIDKQMTSMRSQGLRKRLLKPSVLTADLAAVRALFREEGYTRVVVSPPQISLSADGASAEVDVTINEGTRYSVGEIGYSGGSAATEAQLRAWTLLKQGETFSPRRLAEAEQALKERFDVLGYPDVSVESRVELVGERADIVFEITTGDRKTVGKIAIQGNRVTKDRTIARALTFGVGEVVSNEALLASQQRLYRTGLFSNVKLTCVPESQSDPTAQVVTVKVDEAPPLALGLGVGYDSSDGPGMSFLIGYSNLGGRNVAIALQGRVSRREQRELLTVRRKRVFGNTIDSLGSLLFEKSVEDGFSKSERTLSIRLEQRPKPRWIRFLRYSIQQVKIYDTLDPQKQLDAIFEDKLSQVRLGSFGLGLVRDTRDDAFLPTRGGYGSIEGTVFAKPFGSEATFLQTFLRGSWTVTTKNGNRFSSFLRIGAEYPFAGTEIVPLSERYFAGGINTLRGFATDSVGGIDFVVQTTDPDGNTVTTSYPIGGEAIFLFNQDWSFPIWGSLRGELFFDAGNVYPTLNDFDPSDLRYDAGVGLRLDTPIGPLRLEYGWKLDRQPDESAGELVFAIGTLF